MSGALIPLTIAPFAAGSLNPTTDALLCATLLIHSHIGFEYVSLAHLNHPCPRLTIATRSCIIDYFPTHRVPAVRAAANWLLRIFTVLVGVGLYELETNDVGLTETIKRVWTA